MSEAPHVQPGIGHERSTSERQLSVAEAEFHSYIRRESFGSPKVLALSDAAHASRLEAKLQLRATSDPVAVASLAAVRETMRQREYAADGAEYRRASWQVISSLLPNFRDAYMAGTASRRITATEAGSTRVLDLLNAHLLNQQTH